MPLETGAVAPDFTLPAQDGAPVTLSTLLEKGSVVIFFYPAAETAVCTKEACHFRDLAAEFAEIGAQRIGISKDSIEKQAGFAAHHDLDYPVLSDPSGSVAALYGVKPSILGKIGPLQRTTFAIGADGRIKTVVEGMLKADIHADEALAALRS
ncbi:peroxiredoxin Q/BCP [Nocardioides luteus]|uniref:thioredoxin-dependent peroxiredoxin n=1 Tax=Nocardioides luteus TaxID=1844 RepID=A0ABQ5SRE7_9ACTN|nr:peroxiredoxin [Nocardioides luteus]MDR7311186.1 peroxiredoxin Q/BCP [Nocardioides luteus]GGR62889.1 peroxiredoxin [Nocardioides luteus]GLJ66732.1 putative peroxiredoxin [Nocardioides luteus]